jgi:glycosyltransferase involved in cell wall biosynthesis
MKRILIISHGHPDLSVGGGEIAAYRQCRELRAQGRDVLFMSRDASPTTHGGPPYTVRAGEHDDVQFHSPDFNHFLHSQRAKWSVHQEFRSLLERFAPDVVHFHHYVHLGLELIREVRKYSAAVPIILTLHEFLAICHNHGQMLKTNGRLCTRGLPADCHTCFPEHTPQDFFLRERFIRSFFALVDAFVCPSRFLLERYAAWGLPREKLLAIENGQPVADAATGEDSPAELCRRFAFFGQISEFKGIQVYFEAIRRLPPELRRRANFAVHGTLQLHNEAANERFSDQLSELQDDISFGGPYRPDDLAALMRDVGWVVVPSVWWENSPLVIQEAWSNRRPVICSNIGGMAEKVADGRTGLHFRVGDARDLARRIEQACNPRLWASLRAGIAAPPSIEDTTRRHLDLYASVAERRSGNAVAAGQSLRELAHLPIATPLLRVPAKRARRAASSALN